MKMTLTDGEGKVILASPVERIRNELNQGLLVSSFFVTGGVYIPPLGAENTFTLSYYTDEDELLQTFNQVRFRRSEVGPIYNYTGLTTEVVFMVEEY